MNLSELFKSSAKEVLSDAFPIIEKFSPALAGAIGGPVGFALGYVLPVLANAFNSKPHDISQLVSNIISDPNAQSKLKQIEQESLEIFKQAPSALNKLIACKINVDLFWENNGCTNPILQQVIGAN